MAHVRPETDVDLDAHPLPRSLNHPLLAGIGIFSPGMENHRG